MLSFIYFWHRFVCCFLFIEKNLIAPTKSAKNSSALPQPTTVAMSNQTLNEPKNHEPPVMAKPTNSTRSETLNYTIPNSYICVKRRPHLLIWVYSAPGNIKRRDAIRQTWGNIDLYSPMAVTIVFSVVVTFHNDTQVMINSEQTKFGDIVQDAGFIDAYRNLTYKVSKLI